MENENCSINSPLGHTMEGIPTWMAISALAIIILASHLFLNKHKEKSKKSSYPRWNLLNFRLFKYFVKKKYFPILVQSISMILFTFIIVAGLIGSQRSNISTVLTWTWWWALLIFIILGFGKGFCMICPWEGFASLFTSGSLASRIKKIGFEWKWPKFLRNLYPALALFILLTWIELGFGVTKSPSTTALLGLGMGAMAVLLAILFEKRAFCRYVCLVGRISGIYALFSPVELRAESFDVCRSCKTKDCVKGTSTDTGCSLNLFPGYLQENTYCTLCTECVRACPHDNLAINIRPPATDLMRKEKFRMDEAVMAVVLLALTSFHGITMTPQWTRVNDLLRVHTGFGKLFVFTVLMILLTLLPFLIFWLGAKISHRLTKSTEVSPQQIFKTFAYSLIPVALFYHLAHNSMHFFMEGQYIIPALSDPFGFGWDIFGTAKNTYAASLSLETVWWVQVILILVGHVYGVKIADRLANQMFQSSSVSKLRSLLPLMVTMIFYSSFSLWLIAQPMEMRTGM